MVPRWRRSQPSVHLLGGFLSEKLSGRFPAVVAWLPAVGLLIALPAYILAFYSPSLPFTFAFWSVAAVGHYAYLGAQYSVGTGIVSPRSRATTVAVLLLIVSLIGNGIGPLFVGAMSDFFMAREISLSGFGDLAASFDPKTCGDTVLELSQAGKTLCKAYGDGLRQSMAATVLAFLGAAACFYKASRTYMRDRYNPN